MGALLLLGPADGSCTIAGRLADASGAKPAHPFTGRMTFAGGDLYPAGSARLRRVRNVLGK